MADPLRVLLIAEACNPTWTSVPLVGYNFARALTARPDIRATVVTHVRNRPGLAHDRLADLAEVHYIDTEWIAGPLHKVGRWVRGGNGLGWTTDTALAWPAYMAFEHAVAARLGRRLARGAFDLVHRITPLTPTIGSPLAAMTDVPMLLGPLNGGLPWPREFPHLRRAEKEWLVPVRRAYRMLPWFASTYRRLAGVIAGSRHTAREVPRSFRGKRFYMPENGVDPDRFPVANDWPVPQGPFRFVTVGRLVPYKGVDLILDAMHGASLGDAELLVIGDGPERGRLEDQTQKLGLADRVRFAGWMPQMELANELGRSQVFVFPSLREFGGGVVLEAMARGLPAIVVDYGGPGELVDGETGVKLPMARREELVPRLRQAMEALTGDPDRCRLLGRTACQRVRDEHVWSAKAARLVGVYEQLAAA